MPPKKPTFDFSRDLIEQVSKHMPPKNVLSLRQSARMFRNALPQSPRMRDRLVKLFTWMLKWRRTMNDHLPELTFYLSSAKGHWRDETLTAQLSHLSNAVFVHHFQDGSVFDSRTRGMIHSEDPVELADKLAPLCASVTFLELTIFNVSLGYRAPNFELINADLLAAPVQGGDVKEKGLQRLNNVVAARRNEYHTELDLILDTGNVKNWSFGQHWHKPEEALLREAAVLPFVEIRVSSESYRESGVSVPKPLVWKSPDWNLVDGDLLA